MIYVGTNVEFKPTAKPMRALAIKNVSTFPNSYKAYPSIPIKSVIIIDCLSEKKLYKGPLANDPIPPAIGIITNFIK